MAAARLRRRQPCGTVLTVVRGLVAVSRGERAAARIAVLRADEGTNRRLWHASMGERRTRLLRWRRSRLSRFCAGPGRVAGCPPGRSRASRAAQRNGRADVDATPWHVQPGRRPGAPARPPCQHAPRPRWSRGGPNAAAGRRGTGVQRRRSGNSSAARLAAKQGGRPGGLARSHAGQSRRRTGKKAAKERRPARRRRRARDSQTA